MPAGAERELRMRIADLERKLNAALEALDIANDEIHELKGFKLRKYEPDEFED